MAEVANRTSKGAVFSDVKDKSRSYDLLSWKGLTKVLQDAKKAGLSDEQYNAFRDAVLQYAQSGADPELKKKIDAVIAQFPANLDSKIEKPNENKEEQVSGKKQKKEEATKETKEPAKQETPSKDEKKYTANTRRAPVFHLPTKEETAPEVAVEEKSQLVEEQATVREEVKETVPEPALEVQSETVEVAEAPVVKEAPVPEPAVPQEQEKPKEEVVAAAPVEAPSAEIKSSEEYKARIVEIKREVRERVGNPVAVLASGAEVGKEYMMALLEAMKTVGGGEGSVVGAMNRLEKGYTLLIEYVEKKRESEEPAPEPIEESEDTTSKDKIEELPKIQKETVEVTEAPVPESSVPEEVKETVEAAEVPVPEESEQTQEIEAREEVAPEPLKQAEIKEEVVAEKTETTIAEKPKSSVESSVEAILNKAKERAAAVVSFSDTKQTPVTPEPEKKEEKKNKKIKKKVEKLVKEKKIESETLSSQSSSSVSMPPVRPLYGDSIMNPLPNERKMNRGPKENLASDLSVGNEDAQKKAQEVTDRAAQLSSKEVVDGLTQLLNEWPLFGHSGLFGMGPKGREHPLYQTLAPISMSHVIAGRFDGATSENVKTIKDYTNAWRNEQGVSYNLGETFEHYLLRVVQKTIQRSKVHQ